MTAGGAPVVAGAPRVCCILAACAKARTVLSPQAILTAPTSPLAANPWRLLAAPAFIISRMAGNRTVTPLFLV